MKPRKQSALSPGVSARLTTYAAVTSAALAATAATAPRAQADVIYSGPLALAVPNNIGGIYLDLVTGQTATAFFTGYDINPYSSSGTLRLLPATGSGLVAPTTAGPASALTFGAFIGSTDIFTTSSVATNFLVTGTEYLGLKFVNTTTSAVNYGWIQFQTTATTGFPATILGYAYENTGGAITAGQVVAVPEPSTTMALGLGALSLGAAGVRRWRKARLAVA